MSGFVINENINRTPPVMNFIEFTTLSESIMPVAVEYGRDYKDHQWYEQGEFRCTFFIYRGRAYCVVIDYDGNVGFMTSQTVPPVETLSDINRVGDNFRFDRTKVTDACRTFNQFFYIILQGIQRFDLIDVQFNGFDKELGIYTTR